MTKVVPIKTIDGIELVPTEIAGVHSVRVLNAEARRDLSWDRYIRLKAAADAIVDVLDANSKIIDVGGYDGALALFLTNYHLDLIDPATTGASLLHEPTGDASYELAAAIDILEHIVPPERTRALKELARIARRYVVLNYPCQDSKQAQELILKCTNNSLVREHVQWELPDTNWVLATMADLGFKGRVVAHGSLAVWIGQYLTLNLAPEAAQAMNRYLIEHHAEESFSVPLYHLVVCEREKR